MITLDTELAWGTHGDARYREDYERTRDVIDRLLALFEKYNISATWAIVGHLFLDRCNKTHPEIYRTQSNDDWFLVDPGTNAETDPLWYAPDVVEKIKNCRIRQEIGSHSFSHIVSEDACDRTCFASELQTACKVAGENGISMKSFVYPKNRVKYPDMLAHYGFQIYRSPDNTWYSGFPRFLRKIAHGLDNYLLIPSPVGVMERTSDIAHVPGSYFYVHRHGWARFLPISFRVAKARRGVQRAIRERKIFHLWCHPFNIASDPDALLSGMESILAYVREMIDGGKLENKTMDQLANSHE